MGTRSCSTNLTKSESLYILRKYSIEAKPSKEKNNLDHTQRCSSTALYPKTSQTPKRKRRRRNTTGMDDRRENWNARPKTTPRPKLVVHTMRKHPPQSLHARSVGNGKAASRIRRRKKLQWQTTTRREIRRINHKKSSPATADRRVHRTSRIQRQTNLKTR